MAAVDQQLDHGRCDKTEFGVGEVDDAAGAVDEDETRREEREHETRRQATHERRPRDAHGDEISREHRATSRE